MDTSLPLHTCLEKSGRRYW